QAAQAITQLADLDTKALVDRSPGRSPTPGLRHLVRLRHISTVPNILETVRLPPRQLHRTLTWPARSGALVPLALALANDLYDDMVARGYVDAIGQIVALYGYSLPVDFDRPHRVAAALL